MKLIELSERKSKKLNAIEKKAHKVAKQEPIKVPVTNTAWDEPWKARNENDKFFNNYIEEYD